MLIGIKRLNVDLFVLLQFIGRTKYYQSQGVVEGTISNKPKGIYGFGYDPIFIPKGKKITFGQMLFSKKSKIDHRYKAFKKKSKNFFNFFIF